MRLVGCISIMFLVLLGLSMIPSMAMVVASGTTTDNGLRDRAEKMLDILGRAISVLEQNGVDVSDIEKLYDEAKQLYSSGDYAGVITKCREAMEKIRGEAEKLMKRTGEEQDVMRKKLENLRKAINRSGLPSGVKEKILEKIDELLAKQNVTRKDVADLLVYMRNTIAQYYRGLAKERIREALGKILGMSKTVLGDVVEALKTVAENESITDINTTIDPDTLIKALHLDEMTPEQAVAILKGLHRTIHGLYMHREEIREKAKETFGYTVKTAVEKYVEIEKNLWIIKGMIATLPRDKAEVYKNITVRVENLCVEIRHELYMYLLTGETHNITIINKELVEIENEINELNKNAVDRREKIIVSKLSDIIKTLKNIIGELEEAGQKIVVFGIIAWKPDNKTLVVVGFGVLSYTVKDNRTIWIPYPALRIYQVDISNAEIDANLTLGKHVFILGKITGHGETPLVVLVKAEKVSEHPLYWISRQ